VGKRIPLYGLEQFFEFCAHGQIGVLRWFVGALEGGLPRLVFVVVGVLAGGLLAFLCVKPALPNSSCSACSLEWEEMEEPSTSICSSAWSFSILVVFSINLNTPIQITQPSDNWIEGG
jgi:hypothetical protein